MLAEKFTKEALVLLCYDSETFLQVYKNLKAADDKARVIQRLTEYAAGHDLIPALLDLTNQYSPGHL